MQLGNVIRRPRGTHSQRLCSLSLLGLGVLGLTAAAGAADRFPAEPWGLQSPAGRCVVCHSLERGGAFRSAPNLWNIVNAETARDRDWYAYSQALLEKGGIWTEQDLDAFLADADAHLPGTRKSISVPKPEDRKEIIDFLKTLTK